MRATNPETGTVRYLYNAAHQMTQRTDAKGQQTRWLYDAFGRLQQVQHYTAGGSEIPKRRVTYYYDVNPFVSNWSDNALGRMAAVEFRGENGDEQFTYMYGYNQTGRVTKQRLRSMPGWTNPTFDLDAAYSWDNEGRMTSMTAPGDPNGLTGPDQSSTPPTYTFGFDSMGRTSSMTGVVAFFTMLLPLSFTTFLTEHGISLGPFSSETALAKRDALTALQMLDGTEAAVLGGDVIRRDAGVFRYTHDNWYVNHSHGETHKDYLARSIEKARSYITAYPDAEDGTIFYVLITTR